jgi:hypothetical protein
MRIKTIISSVVVTAALVVAPAVALAGPASADTCTAGSDICGVFQGVQTPAGLVTASADANNVVTVVLTPTKPNTLVFGLPFGHPPNPAFPGLARSSVTTSGGVVDIDTLVPPLALARFNLPNVAVISIHPPSPCRVTVVGTTVTFTPVLVI